MRISDWSSDVCSSDLQAPCPCSKVSLESVEPGDPSPKLRSGFSRVCRTAKRRWQGRFAARTNQAPGMTSRALLPRESDAPRIDGRRYEVRRRSDERRVGKECVRTCSSRVSPYTTNKKESIRDKR